MFTCLGLFETTVITTLPIHLGQHAKLWCGPTQEGRPSKILEYIWIFNGETIRGDVHRIIGSDGWLNMAVRVA